jgi:hypothetical protein
MENTIFVSASETEVAISVTALETEMPFPKGGPLWPVPQIGSPRFSQNLSRI